MKRLILIIAMSIMAAAANAESHYIDNSYSVASSGKGVLSVERTKHFFLNHLVARVYMDGKPVASMRGGDAINLYVPFGRHLVGASAHAKDTGPDQQIAVNITSTQHPILRMTTANGGYSGMKLTQVN